MRKNTFFLIVLSFGFSLNLIASDADYFIYDKEKVSIALTELDALENVVIENPEISLLELRDFTFLMNNSSNSFKSLIDDGDPKMPLFPAFWWGCFTGPLGVFLVYAVQQDQPDRVKSALNGCIVNTLVVTASYVAVIAFGVSLPFLGGLF